MNIIDELLVPNYTAVTNNIANTAICYPVFGFAGLGLVRCIPSLLINQPVQLVINFIDCHVKVYLPSDIKEPICTILFRHVL